jgi:hypothetical protein
MKLIEVLVDLLDLFIEEPLRSKDKVISNVLFIECFFIYLLEKLPYLIQLLFAATFTITMTLRNRMC